MTIQTYEPFLNIPLLELEEAQRIVKDAAWEKGGAELADKCLAALFQVLPMIWKAPGNVVTVEQIKRRCGIREGKTLDKVLEVLALVLDFIEEMERHTWPMVAKQYAWVIRKKDDDQAATGRDKGAVIQRFDQARRRTKQEREYSTDRQPKPAKSLKTNDPNMTKRIHRNNPLRIPEIQRAKAAGSVPKIDPGELEAVRKIMAVRT